MAFTAASSLEMGGAGYLEDAVKEKSGLKQRLMSLLLPQEASPSLGDDDNSKNIKKPSAKESFHTAIRWWVFSGVLSPYVAFLTSGFMVYSYLGGRLANCTRVELIGFASAIIEGFGLLSLRLKIKRRDSVAGISGQSIIMFALTYTLRLWQLWPRSSRRLVNDFAVETLSLGSLFMVLEIGVLVFTTHRKSFQQDIDVLKVKHLIPWCFLVALPLHPSFRRGFFYSYFWTVGFYLDIVSLLPQVVFMAKGNGKVEAPISHYVAATAMSRSIDLWWWLSRGINLGPQGFFHGFNYSGVIIVVVHLFGLLLAGDFLYYYIKSKIYHRSGMSDDLVLPSYAIAEAC